MSAIESDGPRPAAKAAELSIFEGSLTGFGGRSLYRTVFKRVLDLSLVLLTALPMLLVVGVLALLVARDGGRPFYSQLRVGRGGRAYRMWKLRTMQADADSALATYLEANPTARTEWERSQKLKDDPRITRFGRLLRRTSLDELPQLWNVFIGDMSLVGPRPIMVDQAALYPGLSYADLRPGITGPWQISERNECSFAERAVFDDAYDDALSFGTDLRILAGTARVVLRGTGY